MVTSRELQMLTSRVQCWKSWEPTSQPRSLNDHRRRKRRLVSNYHFSSWSL